MDNWLQMQQEAAERVREMQQRARQYTQPTEKTASAESTVPCVPSEPPAPAPLKRFGQDREQLFLLMLAVLLVRNHAPMELILALLYLSL